MKNAPHPPQLSAAPAPRPATAPSTIPSPGPGWWSIIRFVVAPERVWRPAADSVAGRWLVGTALVALTLGAPRAVLAQSDAPAAVPGETTQTLRGTITDAQSGLGLPGATVRLVTPDGAAPRGTATGPDGTFRLAGVPLGRQMVRVSMVGYRDVTVPNVIVNAGKESTLTLQLQESLTQLDAAEVVGERNGDRRKPNNEMALVSARTFDVETTNRFAGARSDPARMAQNFAGVGGANDSRNDIVVRGNSPAGLLWRLDGVNIPNPSHYGAIGTTGGPVSILNNNVLDKSDFLTGAFPATYANALAGVFDLQLRSGNSQKREYLGQIGFNGFEVGIEGPFRRGETPADAGHGKASYLANYRYSTLGVFQKLGVNFGTGTATPDYQDFIFKIDAPRKNGRWTIWGLGGLSKINFIGSEADTTETDLYGDDNEDLRLRFRSGAAGASYTRYLGERTFARLTLSASTAWQEGKADSLSTVDRHPVPYQSQALGLHKASVHALISHKFSAADNVVAGLLVDGNFYDLSRGRLLPGTSNGFGRLESSGATALTQAYAQWQHRFSERVALTGGVTVLHLALNDRVAVEPRVGGRWQATENLAFTAGGGLHSQTQPWTAYFVETRGPAGASFQTNRNLDFTRAAHAVVGAEQQLTPTTRVKLEAYYQRLRRAPVESHRSSFSMLNAGGDFLLPDNDSLVNRGTGRNMGLELTVERTFTTGYYFLVTGSLFDSKYAGSDGVERNTAFNGRYVANALAGREWKFGPNGRNALTLDLKLTSSGGRYTTPIDATASTAAGDIRYVESAAYSRRVPTYFRSDVKIGYRLNRARLTHEFALDVQNVTNRQNVFQERYNVRTGKYATEYQLGLFPIPLYRLTF